MQLGVVLDVLWPIEHIERLAAAAAECGFHQIWLSDHPLGHDPFVLLAHLAQAHPRIRFGLGTVNPSARHPAVIAASAGSVSYLSRGRFSLGLGSSIDPLLEPIGMTVAGQVKRCREAVRIIRQLLETGESSYTGDIFHTAGARARFQSRQPVPLLVGASGGPAMLKMSGEEADGVIIPAGNRGFYEYAVGRFRAARAAAGLSGEPTVIVNGNIAVSDNRQSALDIIRPLVADAISHRAENRHSLEHMGITLEQAKAWQVAPGSLPEEVLRESAIAGTPADCVEGLNAFQRLGITQLAIRFPEESTIRAVGREVLPLLGTA